MTSDEHKGPNIPFPSQNQLGAIVFVAAGALALYNSWGSPGIDVPVSTLQHQSRAAVAQALSAQQTLEQRYTTQFLTGGKIVIPKRTGSEGITGSMWDWATGGEVTVHYGQDKLRGGPWDTVPPNKDPEDLSPAAQDRIWINPPPFVNPQPLPTFGGPNNGTLVEEVKSLATLIPSGPSSFMIIPTDSNKKSLYFKVTDTGQVVPADSETFSELTTIPGCLPDKVPISYAIDNGYTPGDPTVIRVENIESIAHTPGYTIRQNGP